MASSSRARASALLAILATTACAHPDLVGPQPLPATDPDRARPSALFPGRLFSFACGATGAVAHLFRLRPGLGDRSLRMRLSILDPDAALVAVRLHVDDASPVTVDQRGVVAEGRSPVGFEDEGETPFFDVPAPRRRGPHRVTLCPVLRPGTRADRHSGTLRVLGSVMFDAARAYKGIRDLADLMHRRYRDLRELDLGVRKVDSRGRGRRWAQNLYDHTGEAEKALYRQHAVEHFATLNELTFRARREKVDPVAFVNEGLARYAAVYEPWRHAPSGGRMAFLYAEAPHLYESLDEVSIAWARVRDGYYSLAGVEARDLRAGEAPGPCEAAGHLAAGDPVHPMKGRLSQLRDELERLLDMAEVVLARYDERAARVAGNPGGVGGTYPAAKRVCMDWPLVPAMPLEPAGYRGRRSQQRLASRYGRVRGVGSAQGDPCCPEDVAVRKPRNVNKDRYAAERIQLAGYVNQLRGLAHHDLHLVRMWQALLGASPPALEPNPVPRWIGVGGVPALSAKILGGRYQGGTRVWKRGDPLPARKVGIE